MGVSFYKIKKWSKMLLGKSISHVNQGPGRFYSKKEIAGYYNDLTEKVLRRKDVVNDVPFSLVDSGEKVYFSIEIFQYGLGAYDLYLQDASDAYLQKVYACANWALTNQENNGAWKTFAHKKETLPYSAMAQGEGISLLLRAYNVSKNESYMEAAKKAVSFLLTSIDDGGVAKYEGDDVYFMECLYLPLILNGWIFAIWGLYDYCKIFDDIAVKDVLNKTLKSLEQKIPEFDAGYWSLYAEGKMIASPFYHKLHIAQLMVMYDLIGAGIYERFANKWMCYQNSFLKSKYAFFRKMIQKLLEK